MRRIQLIAIKGEQDPGKMRTQRGRVDQDSRRSLKKKSSINGEKVDHHVRKKITAGNNICQPTGKNSEKIRLSHLHYITGESKNTAKKEPTDEKSPHRGKREDRDAGEEKSNENGGPARIKKEIHACTSSKGGKMTRKRERKRTRGRRTEKRIGAVRDRR